ncbi:hypothetical protein ATANTOWER_031496 [Ataeniobius toweri]|uniref:Uncharacterized protein n=1 Tax=Ataeniobius toweri TaxID=208326 RepID=A0ABU7CBZ2_9TELE|nr:hypothetical protein [Ataeniobius toweri]
MPLPAPCLTPLALEFDPVSASGFTPLPNHWFIQPEPAWLSSPSGIIVKRTITALCVPVTASTDSSEDLNQSAIRLQSAGRFLINCLDHFLFWILCLIPRLRRLVALSNSLQILSFIQPLTSLSVLSGSWKLTAVLLLSDPEFLNKPFNLSLCVWLNSGSLSLVVIIP